MKDFVSRRHVLRDMRQNSEAIAIVQQICEKEGIAYQKFVNRSDGSAGGTLGSIVSAILPVRTVDMGIPMFAMHSSREFYGERRSGEPCKIYDSLFFTVKNR